MNDRNVKKKIAIFPHVCLIERMKNDRKYDLSKFTMRPL